jgi:endoglucanase
MEGQTMYEILKTLCEIPGPGGDEGLVQSFLAKRWRPQVDRLWMTGVGNLMAHVGGKGPKLMVAAHADEISFVVKSIGADGYIWITSGERDNTQRPSLRSPVFLPWGHPALILTTSGPVEGFFATLTGHILNAEQREKTRPDWTDIFIDIGASSQAEAEALGVKIGDRIIWNPPTRRVGEKVYGKAMDDRVGLAVMDRLLEVLDRDLLAYDLMFVSTIQEEIGLVGAESAAVESGCTMAIALDIGLTSDMPGVDPRDLSVRLGAGPTIVHKDLSHYNRQFTLALIHTAREADIPVQPAVFGLYGSDSSAFTRHGLKSAVVAIPTRYTHSPFEMLHLHDVEQTVALMKAFLYRRVE